jgi:hypothetical protein
MIQYHPMQNKEHLGYYVLAFNNIKAVVPLHAMQALRGRRCTASHS